MKKEDLKNFTKEEITDLFIQLMNEMETIGNNHMNTWDNTPNKYDYLERYTYASGLLTQFNRTRNKISFVNEQKRIRAEKFKRISK